MDYDEKFVDRVFAMPSRCVTVVCTGADITADEFLVGKGGRLKQAVFSTEDCPRFRFRLRNLKLEAAVVKDGTIKLSLIEALRNVISSANHFSYQGDVLEESSAYIYNMGAVLATIRRRQ
jgi:hypothetical protein